MELSWGFLNELEAEYGDSFYILDLKRFEENYNAFLQAFRLIYPNSHIAYSYKTNYTPRLCQLVKLMGGYAEVVSQMEYELAQRVGVPAPRIIFNGPLKTMQDIRKAVLAGAIVNLDSFYEIEMIEALAKQCPDREIPIGIRCNFDLEDGRISRFGFDAENEEFEKALDRLRVLDNCYIQGLHCHFSSSQRNAPSYALRARKMLTLSARYFNSRTLRYIDLGGGFAGKMPTALRAQYTWILPSYEDYAQAIATQFAEQFPGDTGPELILEPGIGLLGDVMQFVTKIIDIKVVRSRTMALSTGSIYTIKPTLNEKNLPIHVYSRAEEQDSMTGPLDIMGYTCMEHDCLYKGYESVLAVGDYVVFDNVGAYTNVLRPPFIRYGPAIVARDSHGSCELVKRAEQLDDVFSTYIF